MMFMKVELDWFTQQIRGLMALLCQLIYPLIGWIYNLFMNITKVNILSIDQVKPIYQRVTLLLTIIMVFYVTFQFVKYIVQPEQMTDKEQGAGKVVYKLIAVVVLIAFVPKIFDGAYWVQGKIIDNNLIGKVVLGNAGQDVEYFGLNFSANLFSMFYRFETDAENDIDDDTECDGIKCSMVVQMNLNMLRTDGNLNYLTHGLNSAATIDSPVAKKETKISLIQFDFNGLFAVIVGALILWLLAMYCIDVGTRWAQLIFLQIVAPIAIIGYISPKKDGIFQKWMRQCTTTYLDLFLRIAIIYCILLISQLLTNAYSSGSLFDGLGSLSSFMRTLIYVALVLGTMMFAKKAPKMLSELFPSSGAASGEFGLKPRESIKTLAKPTSRLAGAAAGSVMGAAAGLATGIGQGLRKRNAIDKNGNRKGAWGAVSGAVTGAVRGVVGGATRGLIDGGKKGNVIKNSVAGAKKQVESNRRFGNRVENSYGLGDQIGDRARAMVGAKSRNEVLEDEKAPMKRKQDIYRKQAKLNDEIREYAFKKAGDKGYASHAEYTALEGKLKRLQEDKDLIASLGGEDSDAYKNEIAKTKKAMKAAKDKATNEYIDNSYRQADASKNDKNLEAKFAEINRTIEEQNKYDPGNKVVEEAEIEVGGRKYTKKISEMSAEEYDEYIKQVAKTQSEKELAEKISDIEQQQEKIKRQTEGSGINEGGKK